MVEVTSQMLPKMTHCINYDKINLTILVISLLVTQGNLINAANKTVKLVEKIRRQLMENNYDYLPSEEELFPPTHHYDQDTTTDGLNENDTQADFERLDRAVDTYEEDEPKKIEQPVSKKDLFYYIDDERLRDTVTNTVEEAEDISNNSSLQVKYKVIKVKSGHPNRRSLSYRRLLQEEKPHGVALISLDGQPFPQFRLPRARRQYMRDSEDLSEAENATRVDAALA